VIEGRTKVDVHAEAEGRIQKQFFTEGQWVQEGQILYEIDAKATGSLIPRAEATVNQAQARLDFAESQFRRQSSLWSKGATARQDFDQAKNELELAKSGLISAKAALDQAKSEVDLRVARAPVSGYVGEANKALGDLVSPNQPNMTLTTVEDMTTVRVNFFVPESRVSQVRELEKQFQFPDQIRLIPATLYVNGEKYARPGSLERGSAMVDRYTGVMAARAIFPNPDLELFSGQVARIELTTLTFDNVIVVPQAAFVGNKGQTLAVLGVGDVVEFRPVVAVGPFDGFFLIKNNNEGLKVGEKFIVNNLNKISPGLKVIPQLVERPNLERAGQ
jgi:membrane fusion protein (multidrug efflux system)